MEINYSIAKKWKGESDSDSIFLLCLVFNLGGVKLSSAPYIVEDMVIFFQVFKFYMMKNKKPPKFPTRTTRNIFFLGGNSISFGKNQ